MAGLTLLPINANGAQQSQRPAALPATVDMSAAAAAAAAANALAQSQQNAGAIVIPGEWDVFLVPNTLGFSTASATGGSAIAKTAYVFNEDTYNATPTNNGSGAGSIVNTYADGFTGKGYNKLLTSKNEDGRNGVKCYGFTLQYTTTATGVADPAGLGGANPTLLTANLVGANQIPAGMPLNQGIRNTMYQTGIMTVLTRFTLNCLSQMSFNIPVGDTVTLTVFCNNQGM